jgi:hypothetical protein
MTDQLAMFDTPDTVPYQPQSATSRAAAEGMRGMAMSHRSAVLMVIQQSNNGRTDEEIQRMLKLNPSTQRPRRIELVQSGMVRDSGRTRKTASGRAATVWEVIPS